MFIKKYWKDILFWVLFFSLPFINRIFHDRIINLVIHFIFLIVLLITGHQTIKRDIKKIDKNLKSSST